MIITLRTVLHYSQIAFDPDIYLYTIKCNYCNYESTSALHSMALEKSRDHRLSVSNRKVSSPTLHP